MKSFTHYITRHFFSFMLVMVTLVLVNLMIFVLTFFHSIQKDYGHSSPGKIAALFESSTIEEKPSQQILEELHCYGIWAMFLDQNGHQVWTVDTPSSLPENYSLQDVADFSRGYLDDYPVFLRNFEDGILVLGYPKNSYTKLTGNYFSLEAIRKLPFYTGIILLFDFLFLFAAYYISKRKILKNTEPLISAIAKLAEGQTTRLSLTGELSEIAESINKASHIISQQNQARENWISGVSHDIRTPLSIILGYSQKISDSRDISVSVRKEAEIISRQSIKIRNLVQDLNLVSKLEYEMEPLQKEPVLLGRLLRSCAADFLNNDVPDFYSFKMDVSAEAAAAEFFCDSRLITRAVTNLIQNSIQNNPDGCAITLSVKVLNGVIELIIQDDGVGLSKEKQAELQKMPHYLQSTDENLNLRHGLGLLLVQQITEAHAGKFQIQSSPGCGCLVILTFPQNSDTRLALKTVPDALSQDRR